jgi:hypothetical protein
MTTNLSRFLPNTKFPFNTAVLAYIFVGLVALGAFQTFQLARARHELVASALVRDSLEVANDSTRRLTVAGYDTAISLWQRRAYQTEQRADFLDKKLKQESMAREQLSFVVDSLHTVLEGTVVDTGGVRSANFHTYQAPFTVDLGVDLPAPPARGIARVSVTTDTANVGVRLTCGKPVSGIRPANVTVSTPKWLTVRVDSASQDAGVCNVRKPTKLQRFVSGLKDILKVGGGFALGAILH